MFAMIRQLKPIDRQVILSYLEDMDAASIAEVTGLSPSHVATKIHRIKKILSRRFRAGEGMMDDTNPDEAKDLWRNQPLEDTTMSLEQVRARLKLSGAKRGVET